MTNVCTGEEYKRGRTYFSATGLFLSEIVERKDWCLTERSSCLTERSEVRQRNEILLTGDRGKGNFLKERKVGLNVQFPSLGYTLSSGRTHFPSYLEVVPTISLLTNVLFILNLLWTSIFFTFTRALLRKSIIYIHAYFTIANFAKAKFSIVI